MPPGMHAGQEAMLQDSLTMAQKAAGHEMKRSEISEYWATKARTFIRENPLRLVSFARPEDKQFLERLSV